MEQVKNVHLLRASQRRIQRQSPHALHRHEHFFLQFFVKDLPNKIKSRLSVRVAFDFSDVSDHHLIGLHSFANAGEIGYFIDECKCYLIVCSTQAEDVLVYSH